MAGNTENLWSASSEQPTVSDTLMLHCRWHCYFRTVASKCKLQTKQSRVLFTTGPDLYCCHSNVKKYFFHGFMGVIKMILLKLSCQLRTVISKSGLYDIISVHAKSSNRAVTRRSSSQVWQDLQRGLHPTQSTWTISPVVHSKRAPCGPYQAGHWVQIVVPPSLYQTFRLSYQTCCYSISNVLLLATRGLGVS